MKNFMAPFVYRLLNFDNSTGFLLYQMMQIYIHPIFSNRCTPPLHPFQIRFTGRIFVFKIKIVLSDIKVCSTKMNFLIREAFFSIFKIFPTLFQIFFIFLLKGKLFQKCQILIQTVYGFGYRSQKFCLFFSIFLLAYV